MLPERFSIKLQMNLLNDPPTNLTHLHMSKGVEISLSNRHLYSSVNFNTTFKISVKKTSFQQLKDNGRQISHDTLCKISSQCRKEFVS